MLQSLSQKSNVPQSKPHGSGVQIEDHGSLLFLVTQLEHESMYLVIPLRKNNLVDIPSSYL